MPESSQWENGQLNLDINISIAGRADGQQKGNGEFATRRWQPADLRKWQCGAHRRREWRCIRRSYQIESWTQSADYETALSPIIILALWESAGNDDLR